MDGRPPPPPPPPPTPTFMLLRQMARAVTQTMLSRDGAPTTIANDAILICLEWRGQGSGTTRAEARQGQITGELLMLLQLDKETLKFPCAIFMPLAVSPCVFQEACSAVLWGSHFPGSPDLHGVSHWTFQPHRSFSPLPVGLLLQMCLSFFLSSMRSVYSCGWLILWCYFSLGWFF